MKSYTHSTNAKTLDSVHNAMRILKSYSSGLPVKKVMELSRELNLDKSSVSRIIATLKIEGFIEKDKYSSGYKLGPAALTLGNAYKFSHELYNESKPVLKRLVDAIGETAQLAILDDSFEVFFIESIECKHPLRFMTTPGSRSPIYCSSSGKVLLAFRNDDHLIDEVIRFGLTPWTSHTITNEQVFREEMVKIRTQGYGVSMEEKYEGVIAAAAPVFNKKGDVIAAINIVGPSSRINKDKLNLGIRYLVSAANEISKSFLY
ncbi:MAG TPA: IclR family transcriptional regulator [Ureibacillus sp.]|nr:IclR family transcriptional regulator [Ureibacillus sp.]